MRTIALLICLSASLLVSCSSPKEPENTNPLHESLVLEDSYFDIGDMADPLSVGLPLDGTITPMHPLLKNGEGIMLRATVNKKEGITPPCTEQTPCTLHWTISVNGEERLGYISVGFQIETGKAHFTIGPMILMGEKPGSKVLLVFRVKQEESVFLLRKVPLTIE